MIYHENLSIKWQRFHCQMSKLNCIYGGYILKKITKMQNKLTSQAMFWVTLELTVERIKNEIFMTRFSFTICSMTFLQSRGGLSFPKRNNETEKQQKRLKIIWVEYETSDSRLSPLKLGETLHGLIWWNISVFLSNTVGTICFFFFRCPLDGKTMNFERGSNKVHLLCLFHLSYLMP